MRRLIFLLVLVWNSVFCNAGGFQVNLQGQKQTGMGHAGTGLLLDGSNILFNPGAVSFLDSLRMAEVGMNFIISRTEYLEASPGTYTSEMVHDVGTPFTLYLVYKIKKEQKFNFGLGVYTPFGSKAQWPDNWKGQFLLREINLTTIFIQPTFSYKISDKIGVGAGLVYSIGDFTLRRAIPVQDEAGNYGEGVLKGNATSYGFNAGFYFKPDNKWSFGFDYRSSVKISVDDKNSSAVFTVPSSLASYFPSTQFTSVIKLPLMATAGAGYVLNEKIKLAVDMNYVGWSSYDTLSFDFKDHTEKLADIHSPRKYKETFIIRGGMQYAWKPNITVRCGAYYDMAPVPNGYLTPETPDADRIGLTTGGSWKISKRINLDLSLLYIEGLKRTDKNIETQFEGTFKTRAIIPGLGFEVIF